MIYGASLEQLEKQLKSAEKRDKALEAQWIMAAIDLKRG
jgi:hypothetical protein